MKYLGVLALSLVVASCSPDNQRLDNQSLAEPSSKAPMMQGDFDTRHMQNMGFAVESAKPSEITGLYQVMTDQGLVYASADGQFIVSGRIFDITGDAPVNVSDTVLNAMRVNDLATYTDTMIEFKAPNEQHVIHVFTDSTCGYCRQLHERMDGYLEKGITVRYLAWPRSGMQGRAAMELQSVWCAEDSKAALTAVKNDQALPPADCANPVAEHLALGHKFGVRGTPAIVLESGRMLPGYLPPEPLLAEIEKDQ
ncbi:MAG: bifunctional protein-disulfide isomerase/oxidoreductase DsbC [Gammaproteobacteria bacterium]|jgi:thiol:disulfide interchange protein DsbC|nr:bifunctional protein-disulfide isomerase/oxidoreductase DsbC [Gammaproteobacteria bacterium]